MSILKYFENNAKRSTLLSNSDINKPIDRAIDLICSSLSIGNPLLVCGNGGSASDAEHITGELVGRFLKERKGYNAICLSSNAAVMTAWANDYDYQSVFARQVEAHGCDGAVLWGISTSGNSKNVVQAFEMAKQMGITTIALTGMGGGKLADLADVLIAVPIKETPHIQEAHICIYHYMCEAIETRLS